LRREGRFLRISLAENGDSDRIASSNGSQSKRLVKGRSIIIQGGVMTNKIADIDKRSTPRIKLDVPVRISGPINANLINISENGDVSKRDTPPTK